MESIIRNVRDIGAEDRLRLEHVVGRQLRDNQQVIIQVIELGAVPDQETKCAALGDALQLSEQASQRRDALGVSEQEVHEAIDEAIRETRGQKSQSAD